MPDTAAPAWLVAFEWWLKSVSEDAADSPLDLAEAAFKAGWEARDGLD